MVSSFLQPLRVFLLQFHSYWKICSLVQGLVFRLRRRSFTFTRDAAQEGQNALRLYALVQVIRRDFIFSGLAVGAIFTADLLLRLVYDPSRWAIGSDYYAVLLSTLVGVGGFFIGLYYTAVATVAATVYSQVPNRIRDLLAYEQLGNIYLRFLAITTFASAILLALQAVGLSPVLVAVPVVTVAGGLGIVAFVKLGQRAFNLFDPSPLANSLFRDLEDSLRLAVGTSPYAFDRSFQTYAYRSAREVIETLAALHAVTHERGHLGGRPVAQLAAEIADFLCRYSRIKAVIPSDSLWYAPRFEHQDYYRADPSQQNLAISTGTSIQPSLGRNQEWIESQLLPLVIGSLARLVSERQLRLASEVMERLARYSESLAALRSPNAASAVAKEVGSAVHEGLESSRQEGDISGPVEQLALISQIGTLPTRIFLSYRQSVIRVRQRGLDQHLGAVQRKNPRRLYREHRSLRFLSVLEHVHSRMEFERAVEGEIVTPAWYTKEVLSNALMTEIEEGLEAFKEAVPRFYDSLRESARGREDLTALCVLLSCEWEYWSKVAHHFGGLLGLAEELRPWPRIEGLSWPNLDIREVERTVAARQRLLLNEMQSSAFLMSCRPRPGNHPDYAGEFIARTAEALVDALCKNDDTLVSVLFREFLRSSFAKSEQLIQTRDTAEWRFAEEMQLAVSPIIDLVDISGYALLMSHYHRNPRLWGTVSREWDRYLDGLDDELSPVNLGALVDLIDSSETVDPRAMARHNWMRQIANELGGISRRNVATGGSLRSEVDHPSELVRAFSADMVLSPYDGIDVFIGLYVKERPEGAELQLSEHRQELVEQVGMTASYGPQGSGDERIE